MGKKWRILIAALLVCLLGGLGWWLLRPREPSYNGKPLSVWLQDYSIDLGYSLNAEEALRHVGTNAIPTLLLMIRAKDSGLKSGMMGLLARQSIVKVRFIPDEDRNLAGSDGFRLLGADAKNAVPELVQIYENQISTESQITSAYALGYIGPSASNAIPSLLRGLTTTNDPVRWNTAWALGEIRGDPELVVPELVKLLHDPNRNVCSKAAEALVAYGGNARLAVPHLNKMLNDQDKYTREMATNALKQIDSEAAAKAGVK